MMGFEVLPCSCCQHWGYSNLSSSLRRLISSSSSLWRQVPSDLIFSKWCLTSSLHSTWRNVQLHPSKTAFKTNLCHFKGLNLKKSAEKPPSDQANDFQNFTCNAETETVKLSDDLKKKLQREHCHTLWSVGADIWCLRYQRTKEVTHACVSHNYEHDQRSFY